MKKAFIVILLICALVGTSVVIYTNFSEKEPKVTIKLNQDKEIIFEEKDLDKDINFESSNVSFSPLRKKNRINSVSIGDTISIMFGAKTPVEIKIENDLIDNTGSILFNAKATQPINFTTTTESVEFKIDMLLATYLSSSPNIQDIRGVRVNCTWKDGSKSVIYFTLDII